MRIVAGTFKGFNLFINKDKITRPLKDRVRESIFNLLIHSKKLSFQIENSNILDLYAGTGSFGLECLSRKAKSVFFIENEKSAFEILKKNINKLSLKKNTQIFFENVIEIIKKEKISQIKFDLIFCDPPFKNTDIGNLIEEIFYKNIIKKNGLIIIHRNNKLKDKFPDCFKIIESRKYGLSKIIFGKYLS